MSAPTTLDLLEVFPFARDDVYAGGREGILVRYDGTSWTNVVTTPALPSGTGKDVLAIWGTSGDDFWVAMTSGLLRITNRTSLETYDAVGTDVLSVWGTARDDVYGSGIGGTVRRFDGDTWRVVHMNGAFALKDIDGAGSRIIATGEPGVTEAFDGTTWTSGNVNAGGKLINGIFVGETEAFVVGNDRTLKRLNGTTWDPVSFDLSVIATPHLFGAWGVSSTYYAVGVDGKVVRSANATDWSDASPGLGMNILYAIDGTSDGNIFVAGSSGAVWQYSPPR